MIQDMSTSTATAAVASDPVDVMISAAVRGLIAQRRTVPAHVAAAIGVSRSAIFGKLSAERPWKAAEVERLAQFFGVSRDSLYEGRVDFGDATSDLGSEGCRFESCRVHSPSSQPRRGRRRSDRHLRVVPPLRIIAEAAHGDTEQIAV